MSLRFFELGTDGYICIPRGGSTELLVNDGYEGMRLVDAATVEEVGRVLFPEDVQPYPVHRWFMAPDGTWALVFSHEHDVALRLDLTTRSATKVAVPMSMGTPGAVCWFEPHFQLMTEDGLVWGERDGRFVLEPLSPSFERWLENASSSRAFTTCGYFKSDPAAGLLYLLARDPDRLGVVTTRSTEPELRLGPPSDGVVDFAWQAGRWVIGYHDRIEVIDDDGKRRNMLELATNERLGRLNVITHGGARLLVGLISLASNDLDRLLVTELPP